MLELFSIILTFYLFNILCREIIEKSQPIVIGRGENLGIDAKCVVGVIGALKVVHLV